MTTEAATIDRTSDFTTIDRLVAENLLNQYSRYPPIIQELRAEAILSSADIQTTSMDEIRQWSSYVHYAKAEMQRCSSIVEIGYLVKLDQRLKLAKYATGICSLAAVITGCFLTTQNGIDDVWTVCAMSGGVTLGGILGAYRTWRNNKYASFRAIMQNQLLLVNLRQEQEAVSHFLNLASPQNQSEYGDISAKDVVPK